MTRSVYFLVCIIAALITTVPANASSQFMLMASPMRMIFTDRQRAVKMVVVNHSDEQVRYEISVVTLRYRDDGRYVATDETEKEKMIRKMIRFSPRRATIGPNERQVVKLMVRKPKDLPPGEYRTQLQLAPIIKPEDYKNRQNTVSSGQGLKIDLDVVVNTRFPIIIQHKLPPAEVSATALTIQKSKKGGNEALITFSREGQLSSFGNVLLFYVPKNSSKQGQMVGQIQGVAIYRPQKQNQVKVKLNNITEEELKSGSIRVQYIPSRGVAAKRPGKNQKMTSDFPLGV